MSKVLVLVAARFAAVAAAVERLELGWRSEPAEGRENWLVGSSWRILLTLDFGEMQTLRADLDD